MKHILPLIDALSVHAHHYKAEGDYSATGIIDSPRITALKKRHGHLVEFDPRRDISSFNGTGIHRYFEHCLSNFPDKYTLEQRVSVRVLDRVLSGQLDIWDIINKEFYDIKTCKTWKIVFDPHHVDWTAQLNIYKWLWSHQGYDINRLTVIADFMDWQKGMALRSKDYPQDPVIQYPIKVWTNKRTTEFIYDRMHLHIDAEKLSDEELPACTREERWERFSDGAQVKYAVLPKRDAKRAKRVLNSMDEAVEWARSQKTYNANWMIEVRYAERTRCEHWCEVAPWCNHYKQYCVQKETDTLNDYIRIGDIT